MAGNRPSAEQGASDLSGVQVFFTARELAQVSKDTGSSVAFPSTESAVIRLIKREGWNNLPDNLARKRPGRGGAQEYNFSILPDTMQIAIRERDRREHLLAAQHTQAASDRALVAQRPTMSLNARQRNVMEKRNQVLLAISGFIARNGTTRAKAIAAFVAAQKEIAKQAAITGKRDAGEPLNEADLSALVLEPRLTSTEANGFGISLDVLQLANDRPCGKTSLSRSTLYEWFKLRREAGVAGLAPMLTKEEEPVPDGFADFLRFYAMPMKPSATEALQDYLETNPPAEKRLSIDQVRRTLKVKLNDIERNVGREGLLTLRSRMAYVSRTTEALWPTTVYVADGKTFDAEVADWKTRRPIKPELTSILDVATRRCVGIAISRKENTIAVTEALRNACVDHGIPAIFYTDRGAGYKNKTMDGDIGGLMGRLSITKMHALPYNSQAKGIVERFNRTAWNPLAQKLPTYLGAEMDKEAKARVHKQTRSDIIEFGQSSLLPTWDEFRAMCDKTVAEYNARPHSGLPKWDDPETGKRRHMSPDEAWAAHVAEGFEAVQVEEELRDDLFRPYEIRTARRGLIEWNSNTYFHDALVAYNGEKVLVGYDDTQARFVWVRELDARTGQPGKYICKADFTGNKVAYVPLTAQRAAEERRAQGRMRRVAEKVRDIEAELSMPMELEHAPEVPLPDMGPQAAPITETVDSDPAPEVGDGRRRVFKDDTDFVEHALERFEELTEGQISYAKELLAQNEERQIFRMAGVDVEALETLLRAHTGQTSSKEKVA